MSKITLGSGNLYYKEFSGSIPENSAIETENNRLGYISGGATLEYKPTIYEAKDRSEERRVGKECLRLCRSRWSPYH